MFRHSNGWQVLMLIIAIGCFGMWAPGCAEEVDPSEYFRQAPTERFGLLVVTYHEDKFGGESRPQVSVGGFFARHAELSQEQVLSILNLPDVLGSNVRSLAHGNCLIKVRGFGDSELSAPESVFVDLLDAGDIRLETGEIDYRLTRRSFPDIFLDVTGVTYEGIFSATHAAWEHAVVSVSSCGSLEVGDFVIQMKMPSVPKLLEIGGVLHSGEYASIDWNQDFLLRWAGHSPLMNEKRGSIFVELSAIELERKVSLHCRSEDTGVMVIPIATLAEIKRHVTGSTTLRMVVRRLGVRKIKAAGVESAELHLISRDSVLLQ